MQATRWAVSSKGRKAGRQKNQSWMITYAFFETYQTLIEIGIAIGDVKTRLHSHIVIDHNYCG